MYTIVWIEGWGLDSTLDDGVKPGKPSTRPTEMFWIEDFWIT